LSRPLDPAGGRRRPASARRSVPVVTPLWAIAEKAGEVRPVAAAMNSSEFSVTAQRKLL
jgi:hypothetical protein